MSDSTKTKRTKKQETLTESVQEVAMIVEVETTQEPAIAQARPPLVRKKRTPNPLRMYFHAGTQAAIVLYQQTPDRKAREKIYVKDIMPAYVKLVENLINIHKFTSLHDSFDDLKNDCVNFLFETICKFDPNRGTNAFSYFNVVAKNWLIIRTKQKAQRSRRSVSLDDPDALNANELRILEDHCTVGAQDVVLENADTAKGIVEMLHEIRAKSKSENELIAINCIITIFENIDDVDILNKTAVLLYMRELSGLSPKQLTTSLQNIKRNYKMLKEDPKFKLF